MRVISDPRISLTPPIFTPPCVICGQSSWLELQTPEESDGLAEWLRGRQSIQEALPRVSPQLRELVKTGIHAPCWRELMIERDDDEEEED